MTISQAKYVSITSGIGGADIVTQKELIGRIYTTNTKAPVDTNLEFTDAPNVGLFFGTASLEYLVADKYFSQINEYQNKPNKISFFRDDREGIVPALYATVKPVPLANFKAITDGGLSLSMGGVTYSAEGIDLSGADSYAAVAALVQEAIRTNTAGGELWTLATVTFNAQEGVFIFMGGVIGDNVITAATAPTEGTDLSAPLGWAASTNPLISQGKAVSTTTAFLDKAFSISNNFGSFKFLEDTYNNTEAEKWTHSRNVQAMFIKRVLPGNYKTEQETSKDFDGVGLNYDAYEEDSLAWVIPMSRLASTDYDREDGTVSYMYVQSAGTPVSVSDDPLYDDLTPKNINFYGATQQAGKQIAFYQPGMLQGSISDMGVYANEIWLKDAMSTKFLNHQLAVAKWPANAAGLATGNALAQDIILQAKTNGTISIGKELTANQKAFITQLTQNADAWREVFANGSYYTAQILPKVIDGVTKYVYQYRLVYSKGDVIRFVDGTHTLI